MQIDPKNITNFSRTDSELQAFWIFGCIVAGKNSDYAARVVTKLLQKAQWTERTPFEYFRELGEDGIRNALVSAKSGNYTRITRFIMESLMLDSITGLKNASLDELMSIHGIGPKTARFFVLHTRPNVECAVLDVHILKYLKERFPDAPSQTPSRITEYAKWEYRFLQTAKQDFPFMSMADIDLMLWVKYSGRLEKGLTDAPSPSYSPFDEPQEYHESIGS